MRFGSGSQRRRSFVARLFVGQNRLHFGRKTVSAALDRQNVAMTRSFSECFSHHEHGLGEIRLFHEAVGPHGLDQFVLADDLPTVLHQQHQHVEGFRRERNRFFAPAQHTVLHVHPDLAECVQAAGQTRYRATLRIFEKD